ncbi:MAG: tRNA (adenosine(37)-N6)-threonylcarbamoyltransferase complex dimerization subunit type 1 TsaB [Flavobacteriales bacterium]|nr:tRNA (adenosine(37)-N6)-threonylcarbamoyltransferase complex dimerization subunit type 1 TsaB [Flavobacteriales bacterium]
MSLVLNIETATPVCSVALGEEGNLLGFKETADGKSHATHITIFIEELLKECGKSLNDLDAIAVSKGPGSYTGLRIGVSTAKGLCYSLDKPLISVDTMMSMANAFAHEDDRSRLLCPMLDARRMEVYSAVYDAALQEKRATSAVIIDENAFSDFLKSSKVLFFGDGADKCEPILGKHKNARFDVDYQISATSMVSLSAAKFEHELFEDIAYFEPYYLKEFVAGKPKKLIP